MPYLSRCDIKSWDLKSFMRRLILAPLIAAISLPTFAQECSDCLDLDGYVSRDEVSETVFKMVGGPNQSAKDFLKIQIDRGVRKTGTKTVFPQEIKCPLIDPSDEWAEDYTHKRKNPFLHKGIDIVAPKGTPVLAAASGTVIAKYMNQRSSGEWANRKGIEIILRHTPEQTGLPFFIYTQYFHLLEMPSIPIGTKVEIGEEIAKIWNTGLKGKHIRRSALHYAVLYSESPDWTKTKKIFAPKNGYFMDPVYFYSDIGPYESTQVKSLPKEKKRITIPYQLVDGNRFPVGAKRIWPFACKRD